MSKDKDLTDTTPSEQLTSVSFGKWLQEQRIKRNISLEEIAAVTKVHITQLKHLEQDERDNLPASAFVRGFLIAYARHLGLNEDETLTRYRESLPEREQGELTSKPALRAAQSASQPKVRLVESSHAMKHAPGTKDLEKPKPKMLKAKNLMLIGGAVILLVGLAMLISLGKKARKKEAPATVPTATDAPTSQITPPTPPPPVGSNPPAVAQHPAQAPAPAPNAKPAEAAAAAAPTTSISGKKYSLELRPIEQSWVNVRLDDKDSSGMIVTPGNKYNFEADRKILLSLSDAGSVEIFFNGVLYAPPGFRGDVRSLTLPDQLAKLTPKSAITAAAGAKHKKKAKPAAEGLEAPAATPAPTPAPGSPTE